MWWSVLQWISKPNTFTRQIIGRNISCRSGNAKKHKTNLLCQFWSNNYSCLGRAEKRKNAIKMIIVINKLIKAISTSHISFLSIFVCSKKFSAKWLMDARDWMNEFTHVSCLLILCLVAESVCVCLHLRLWLHSCALTGGQCALCIPIFPHIFYAIRCFCATVAVPGHTFFTGFLPVCLCALDQFSFSTRVNILRCSPLCLYSVSISNQWGWNGVK